MKKTRENLLEKLLQQKRHPIRPKLISALLSVCLLLASLPVEFFGAEAQAKEQEQKILSFTELPQEVKCQNVELGTPLEELNLPKTLEAICVPFQYAELEPVENQGQLEINSEVEGNVLEEKEEFLASDTVAEPEKEEISSGVDTEANSEANSKEGEEALSSDPEIKSEDEEEPLVPDTEGNVEEQPQPAPEEQLQPEPEAAPEEQPEAGGAVEETVVIEHVAWTSVFAYDNEKEGTYVFVPVLPEGYVLGDGVSLPEIQIAVESEDGPEEEQEGKEAAKKGKRDSRKETEELEEEYGSWETELALAGAASEVISVDTVWDEERTRFDGELVIEEGVTLTLNSILTIRGTFTIRGGGIIAIGRKKAGIVVKENGFLTLQEMAVDGKNVVASVPTLDLNGGTLTMKRSIVRNCETEKTNKTNKGAIRCLGGTLIIEDGCVIQDCNSERGAVIGVYENATAYLKNSKIERCSADSKDSSGIIYCESSTVTLEEGCVIQDCFAKDGAAIELSSNATGNLKDVRIEGCSASYYGGAISCYFDSELIMEEGCVIRDCEAPEGGAIYLRRSGMSMRGCKIENCDGGYGGAVYVYKGSSANLKDCKIENCKGFYGGAIFGDDNGTLTIDGGCVIQGCMIRSDKGCGGSD